MLRLALLLAFTAPACAETPMTAEEFDALTLGRTMTWSEFGQVYGVEQYLPGRKVRWTVLGDDCKTGHWYEKGEEICFQYEDDLLPDCWTIIDRGATLDAHYATSAPGTDPVIVAETVEPMACFGPEVGV